MMIKATIGHREVRLVNPPRKQGVPAAPANRSEGEVRVRIEAPGGGYEAIIGAGLLDRLGEFLAEVGLADEGLRAFIGHDAALPGVIVDRARAALAAAGLRVMIESISADERSKTMAGMAPILECLARSRHERGEPVIALGGGIAGDVVGFAAAIYRRGVPVIQCPTTLLAMVDASIGGKTAVNLEVDGALMKNLIGAFHQPRVVIADVTLLASLPDRQMKCGLAECIKHGMIGAEFGESALLEWIEKHAAALLARDAQTLVELVARNVALKARVVALDEREEAADGGRALLNLGHTFGHAVETIEEAGPEGSHERGIHHGEAVALGLIAAAHCAQEAGVCDRAHHWPERITEVVARCGLPMRARGLPDPHDILARMAHDKKVRAGAIRLVLPTAPGRASLFTGIPEAAIIAGIRAISARS